MADGSLIALSGALIAVLMPLPANAEDAHKPAAEVVISNDRAATCYDGRTGASVRPMLVRSQVLVAPDGKHRAYIESLAATGLKLPSRTGGWLSPECANVTHVFVADSPSEEFRQVLTLAPTEDTLGNAIRLVDWSPNGRYLLLEATMFQWASDFGDSDPVIYDARTDSATDPSLLYRAFKRRVGRDCVVSLKPVGFSSDGKVMLEAGPSYPFAPESDQPESNSCLKSPGTWAYDPEAGNFTGSQANYTIRHFGTFEGGAIRK